MSANSTLAAPPAPQVLFTREQAAQYLAISVRAVDEWTRDGRIRATRLGRLVRYHKRELDRVAEQGV